MSCSQWSRTRSSCERCSNWHLLTYHRYGGVFETSNPAREYTLDDFITLNLEKLDRYVHIRGTGLEEMEAEWRGSDDETMGSDSDDESDEDDDVEGDDMDDAMSDEEEDPEEKAKRHNALSQAEKDALRKRAQAFLGTAKDAARTEEDILSTPLPGENLRLFYDRSRELVQAVKLSSAHGGAGQYWAAQAYEWTGSRGKALRREGFGMSETLSCSL